jgi:CRP-like cAMP-binding protein
MFTSKGLIESYLPDQIIFKQGDHGDGFYLLLRGSVGVSVNGRPVSRIQQSGFFGEISMIADVPRTATIYALEHTQVLKISRDAFWEILSQNINMAMFIESIGEMRIREDIEILKGKTANVA